MHLQRLYPDTLQDPSLSSQCRHKTHIKTKKSKNLPVRQSSRLSYCPVSDCLGRSWDCNPLTGAGSNPLGASLVEDLAILLTAQNTLQTHIIKIKIHDPPETGFSCLRLHTLSLTLLLIHLHLKNMAWKLQEISIPTPTPRRAIRRNIRDPRLPSYRRPPPLPLTPTPRTLPLEYAPVAEARPCRPKKFPPPKVTKIKLKHRRKILTNL